MLDQDELDAAVESFRLCLDRDRPADPEVNFHLAEAPHRRYRRGAMERYHAAGVELDHDYLEAWTADWLLTLGTRAMATGPQRLSHRHQRPSRLPRRPLAPGQRASTNSAVRKKRKRTGKRSLNFDSRGPWAESARRAAGGLKVYRRFVAEAACFRASPKLAASATTGLTAKETLLALTRGSRPRTTDSLQPVKKEEPFANRPGRRVVLKRSARVGCEGFRTPDAAAIFEPVAHCLLAATTR